jgi:PHD/YefM family antitoxin component YafN of YafNO toxin-antitoxin module
MIKKAQIISLKDFRLYTSKYINEVKRGASYTVLKKNEPVFTIIYPKLYDLSSIPEATDADMEDLRKSKTVLSFKKEGGIPVEQFVKKMKEFEKLRK